MKKLFLVSMLCLTFTIPAKADFWKKLKNAVTGTGSSSSSSNSSGKTGGTRGYIRTDNRGNKEIVNPFDKNDFRAEDNVYSDERTSIYRHKDLKGTATKVNYIECRLKPGGFLEWVGKESYYGYVKFPVYKIIGKVPISGCFSRDKSGKEMEINDDLYLDHNLAMYIWDNQLTVTTLAMKNGKAENGYIPWFDSTNPEAEIYINGKKFN